MIIELLNSNMEVLVFSVLFLIIGFFVSREIYCWYFKINERNEILKKNQSILSEILYELKNKNTNER